MDQIKTALTSKLGPFPGWAWAGLVVVGGFLIWPHIAGLFGSSGAASTAPTPDGGQPAGSPPPEPVPPGAPPPAPAPAPTAPPPKPSPASPPGEAIHKTHVVGHWPAWDSTLWGIAQHYLGNGARWPEIWALSHFRSGDPNLIYPGEVAVLPLDAVGGPRRPAASIGSRRAQLMTPHHPDLNQRIRFPQHIAVGGPATAHPANIHRVAAETGVHPARLWALNPTHRGLIRVA